VHWTTVPTRGESPHGPDTPRVPSGECVDRGQRSLAYCGYATCLYARTVRWAFVSENRGRGRRLYDLARDPAERNNVAQRHPRLIDELYRRVVREAGGRPPIYRS
jgi:hypothetical protein